MALKLYLLLILSSILLVVYGTGLSHSKHTNNWAVLVSILKCVLKLMLIYMASLHVCMYVCMYYIMCVYVYIYILYVCIIMSIHTAY